VAAGAEVIGVSADTQETSDRFAQSLGLGFPLLGDSKGEVIKAYKVGWPLIGLAQRVTYLIGKDRKISSARHAELDADSHVANSCELVSSRPA
jgi:peroxiredoxin Q/BCP